jgi:hypothetical protein
MKYDPAKAPSVAQLNEVEDGDAAKGIWKGWGYYFSVSSDTFRKE